MEGQNRINNTYEYSVNQQHEDAALKSSMQFFADELLPYLNIEGKVIGFAPTELVHLELKKMYQDFNLIMEDGSWKHFEFQSTNEGKSGLRRFHLYEALTEYEHNVDITTYVLFSGRIKKPMISYTSGINTYHIQPIIMRERDGDHLIRKLQEKIQKRKPITKDELVPLTLCPLMGGIMSQKDRISSAFEIMRSVELDDVQTVQKIEAVIYAMAEKFLTQKELEELKEEIKLTRLGQMLVEDGFAQGITQGLKDLIAIKLQKGQSVEEIAEALEKSVDIIRELISEMKENTV